MSERAGRSERHHERIWRLLPWYVNGTLSAVEQRIVADHLSGCVLCSAELESCRRLGAGVREAPEVAPSPHPAQFARLMARIESEEMESLRQAHLPEAPAYRRAGGLSRLFSSLGSLLVATPWQVRTALAAQLVFVLLLAGAFAYGGRPAAEYRTLSDPATSAGSPAAPGASSALIRVMFADQSTEKQIRELLGRIGGHIVGGPSAVGAYIVDVPATGRGLDSEEVVLAFLHGQPAVSFAQPVAGSAIRGPAAESQRPGERPAQANLTAPTPPEKR